MEIEFFKKLSGDLTNLLKNGEDSNTSYGNMNIKKIRMPNIPVNAFEIIIKYIYGGIVSFDKVHTSTILDLSAAASELCLEELVNIAQLQLVKDHPSWIRYNFAKVFKICFEYENFKILKDFCNEIIAKTPKGKIWDYVIRWGIAQNPNLDSNSTQWSDANFSTLKTTLKNCLPHIRYFHISGEDVIKKLYPYQQIIEPNLWKDIITKFAAPNMPITSTVLPPRKFTNIEFPPRNTGILNGIKDLFFNGSLYLYIY
ncbi:hypothetical protein C2G38_2181430 [Gigaspora rosea]|uniref:BTB domain-containing protein n=1 Tax=Gigaspora rosea TaxID=44941 RepID=A0A397VAV5_9GLOM|nr:hypothetical protein C2G38_2181430 [Gigaspora rosea]